MSSQQAAYLLREFYHATGWNSVDNHYATLTHPSRRVLDFAVHPGLHLSLASHPTAHLSSALALSSLVPETAHAHAAYPPTTSPVLGPPVSPLLAGQLAYLFSSTPLSATATRRSAAGPDRIDFKRVVESYGTEAGVPERPCLRDDARPTWHRGERVDRADYLLYGRVYAPSPRLDALYVLRTSTTSQLVVSLITVPSPTPTPTLSWQNDDPSLAAATTTTGTNGSAAQQHAAATTTTTATPSNSAGTAARLSELELKWQQDTGRWSSEYSYAVGDGMWGVRGLYNFGKWGAGAERGAAAAPPSSSSSRERVVDEEDEVSTGLKGRWSAGGEVYFSAQERSAGLSTGLRFSTIPEAALAQGGYHVAPQPPTTVTATLNPIMGQLSTAYTVQTSRDSSLASRFDFNMYSYDADLTVGGEWFQRKNKGKGKGKALTATSDSHDSGAPPTFDAFGRGIEAGGSKASPRRTNNDAEDEVTAVLKVRASTNSDVAMSWEGRMGDFLVSLGLVADLKLATQSRGRISPIRSVGLGISYWA